MIGDTSRVSTDAGEPPVRPSVEATRPQPHVQNGIEGFAAASGNRNIARFIAASAPQRGLARCPEACTCGKCDADQVGFDQHELAAGQRALAQAVLARAARSVTDADPAPPQVMRQSATGSDSTRAPGILQRNTDGPQAPPQPAGLIDPILEGLQVAEGALDLSLDVINAEPLTTDEMYELLVIRRAEPLSIPVSSVNTATATIEEIDGQIAQVDNEMRQAGDELRKLRKQGKPSKGPGSEKITQQIQTLETQAKKLASQRKRLLADKVKITRGQRLGTIGKGAEAGTGQITYAAIQVIDAEGKRIALEFAETSSEEHAEERIVGRLRAMFTPQQLKGAHIIVLTDQKVCKERCQPALIEFAEAFGVEVVESRYKVRSRIDRPGDASPRTTLRTTTKASSEGLPVTEKTEIIYRTSPSKAAPTKATSSTDSPQHGPASPSSTIQDESTTVKGTNAPEEPDVASGRRTPATGEPPHVPGRSLRMGPTAMEAGGNFIIDFIIEILVMKYQQWRNDVNLRERLLALQPHIQIAKMTALNRALGDPWDGGVTGRYYNIYLRITSTTTTEIGGGHAQAIPGSPRPEFIGVDISGVNTNKLLSDEDAVKVPTVGEGATGGLVYGSDTQLVVYSEPVE